MSADIVRLHFRNGEFALAVAAAKGALATAEGPVAGELWALLARGLCRLGDPREAARAAEQALVLGKGWEISLACGEAFLAAGEVFRARSVLQEALAARRSAGVQYLGEGTVEQVVAEAVSEQIEAEVWLGVALAEACRAAGDAATGVAVAARALASAEARLGSDSLETAEALLALAANQHTLGQDDRARGSLIRCLRIRRAIDPLHPDVAATLDMLGLVERARNHPFEAVKNHNEALTIWVARLGERAGPVGACRHALAQALHRTGDFEGARREMGEAVVITGRAFGADHLDTWIARFEYGRFDLDCGQVEEGIRAMETARAVVASRLGDGHPIVAAMNRWL